MFESSGPVLRSRSGATSTPSSHELKNGNARRESTIHSSNQRSSTRPSVLASMSPTETIHERILREIYDLYEKNDGFGLCKLSSQLECPVLAPRRKIIVLLIGNHSAGKSSFINWYVEEHIQRTGVAIETQGFTFVTSGKKRETLTGHATLQAFPRFQPLERIEGISSYLQTEVSSSKQKRFPLVTFVDTPGLVDGDMSYPFDVNKGILWLGNQADLIFVFFDPIGQALCKRTMTLVERLNAKHADKIRFYLSKADEAGDETDRQRVMMQIVQELCKRPGLNRAGFDMPTIYIPDSNKPSRCANQIEGTCREIEKTINLTVQNSLNSLGHDAEMLLDRVRGMVAADKEHARLNQSSTLKRTLANGFLTLMLTVIGLTIFAIVPWLNSFAKNNFGMLTGSELDSQLNNLKRSWGFVPEDYQVTAVLGLLLFSAVSVGVVYRRTKPLPRITKKKRTWLEEAEKHLEQHVLAKKRDLYDLFVTETVGESPM